MAQFKAGQSVKITADQTRHNLPIGSIQTIDHIDSAYGLPYIVVIDKAQAEQPFRCVVMEDVKPLDTLTA